MKTHQNRYDVFTITAVLNICLVICCKLNNFVRNFETGVDGTLHGGIVQLMRSFTSEK